MTDFENLRRAMVDSQLRTSGVLDARLLSAIQRVPREAFVPEARRPVAYIDGFQPLGDAAGKRFMPSATTFARLAQLAEVQPDDDVLDLGAGTGYATAVLARLARTVVGLEPDPMLAASAANILAELGIGNASVMKGDLDAVAGRTFDVIYVGWVLAEVPQELVNLLRPGGRLVAVLRSGGVGIAHLYVSGDAGVTARAEFNATMPDSGETKSIQEFVF